MTDPIVVRNVGKQFRRFHADRPTTLQEALLRGFRRLTAAERFWALQDVSFRLRPGSMVGVVGHNGAGKSTLLRLVGGVGRPDRGTIEVQGRIGALLDLGAGFHSDLTGRENVFVSGVIAGLTRREVAERFDDIVAFAELEAFIDSPLRTYSTGMQMRLAFAVAAHIDPDVLLIDEVLTVGDLAFQQKCLDRIKAFKQRGCTTLIVSHDADTLRQICDEALWLDGGRLVQQGVADRVLDAYVEAMRAETRRRTSGTQAEVVLPDGTVLRPLENRMGSLELQLQTVRLMDRNGHPVTTLKSGEALRVELDYVAPTPIDGPIFSVTVRREDGLICYDTNTALAGLTLPQVQGRGTLSLQIERLDLNGGSYFVDVGVYERGWTYAYDYHWHAYPLLVRGAREGQGVMRVPHRWDIESDVALANGMSRWGETTPWR